MGGMSIAPPELDFSQALMDLRLGAKLTRVAWRDSGIFVVYQKAYPQGIKINSNTAEATGIPEGTTCIFKPYLMQRTAAGAFMPWTPNQDDVLATDWMISTWTASLKPSEIRHSPQDLDYREAAQLVEQGLRVSRDAWGNARVYIHQPGVSDLRIHRADGVNDPWLPSESDRSATDWYVPTWSGE